MSIKIQATSFKTPAYDVIDRVLLPVEHGSTSAQDTDDNVTNQPMTAKILYVPTGPSSPTGTPSAYNVESPVSYGKQKEHMASLLPYPPDGPVSSAENYRVA
ncbi:hypothetical protein PoB_002092900 [Plakobranchus ocellatus]|uniref:Uncharacterized protein n=1 Tax=Plakobranchus ocellatus TaxID=259542 RepID=A0AAV3ZGF9_9GAST|nr:hypothetical protein PoB_002092900 [Plakobranchus ocellatus]